MTQTLVDDTISFGSDAQKTTRCTEAKMRQALKRKLCAKDNYSFSRYAATNHICISSRMMLAGVWDAASLIQPSLGQQTYGLITADVDDDVVTNNQRIAPVLAQYEPLVRLWEDNGIVTRVLPDKHYLGRIEVIYVELANTVKIDETRTQRAPIAIEDVINAHLVAAARIAHNEDIDLDGLTLMPHRWILQGKLPVVSIYDLISTQPADFATNNIVPVWAASVPDFTQSKNIFAEPSIQDVTLPTPGVLYRKRMHRPIELYRFGTKGQPVKSRPMTLTDRVVCPTERYAKLLLAKDLFKVGEKIKQARERFISASLQQEHFLIDVLETLGTATDADIDKLHVACTSEIYPMTIHQVMLMSRGMNPEPVTPHTR